MFSIGSGAKWLIVIVVGFILIFQYIKLLFEIGERYVVTSVLTFFAPLAFAMGGSKEYKRYFSWLVQDVRLYDGNDDYEYSVLEADIVRNG